MLSSMPCVVHKQAFQTKWSNLFLLDQGQRAIHPTRPSIAYIQGWRQNQTDFGQAFARRWPMLRTMNLILTAKIREFHPNLSLLALRL